jgi:outer membrane protein TolC
MNKLDQAREEAFYAELSTQLSAARQRAASERERLTGELGLEADDAPKLPQALPPLPKVPRTLLWSRLKPFGAASTSRSRESTLIRW